MDTQYTEWLQAVRGQGMSDDDIRNQLHSAGWADPQIDELLHPSLTSPPQTPTEAVRAEIAPTVNNQQPIISTPSTFAGPIALYRATFSNYTTRFGYYFGYGAIASFASLAITGGLLLLLYFLVISKFNHIFVGENNLPLMIGVVIFVYLGLIVLNTLIASWLWSAIGLTVMVPDGQRRFFGILVEAIKRIPQVIWANLIVGYILSGFSILSIIANVFGGFGVGSIYSDSFSSSYLLPLIGVILYFVFMAWLGTYLVYTPFVALMGKQKGLSAVRESQTVVHGMWWRTFGRLVAIAGPIILITLIIQFASTRLGIDPLIPSLIFGVLDIALLLPLFITYTLGMYNTAANYRQNNKPVSKISTISMLIVATLGWLILIGGIVLAYMNVREYTKFNDTFLDESPLQYPVDDYLGSTIENSNTNEGVDRTTDIQRTTSLNQLQWALEIYFESKNSFPATLSALVPTYTESIPVDPDTNQPFEYIVNSKGDNYTLCATLSTGESACVNGDNVNLQNTNSGATVNTNQNVSNTNSTTQNTKSIYEVRTMIDSYYNKNKSFPINLSALIPTYTPGFFTDENGGQFTYTVQADGKNYKICQTLPTKVVMCIYTALYIPNTTNTNSNF